MATSLIKNFIAKTLFRQKGAIANNKAVDFSANALETRLKNFGVDVNGIQNEKQLNEILAIIKQREDNMFAQQFGDVLSKRKSAKVFDLEGKEIKNPKNIMGGKAFEPQGLSDKEFRSEKTSFRLNISKNSPEFNQDLAKKIINREIYTDLSDSQRKQFLDDLDFVLKNPRDGNAQGGRAGFKSGLSKLFKEFMERRKFLKTMVGNTEKNRKARELQMLKEAMENARKNPGFEFPSGKELRTDLEKKIGPILLKDRTLNSDGGRAGFSRGGSGILKFLQNILKPKKSRIFDEERFRKGPIDMDFLENIDKKDLEKFITTRDTGGRGGYGMYDNFKDMPAGLRAAELISTIKGPRNEINYKAAELFLGKKLRGDESADELIQILNSQEMRAEGGRAGYKFGIGPLFKLLSKKSPKQAYTDYLKSVKDRAQKGDMKSLAPELGAVTATGVFINRRMKDILENMKNQDMENNLENFKKELDADPFYKEYPEIKDKMIEGYTEMMFGEKKAEGGRAGFANGTGAPSIILNPKEESMGPEFETNDPGEAAKEIIKRLIRVEGAKIPLTEKGLLSLNIDNLDEQSIGGIIDLLGGELQFGVGKKKGDKGGGIIFRKEFDKGGMSRRTFLKLLGGLASVPIIGKFIKPMKVGKKIAKVPIIKTDNVPGKPEWFDALVNKVIIEGDDVTKRFATAERQTIHQKTLNDGTTVRVTQDTDQGAVRVEYESEQNVFGDPVEMEYKKPLPDEGDPTPSPEFTTSESGPVARGRGPDDYDIDVDEVGGTSISDLDSDVSKLKEYATGKKLTMKEILESKKRKDKAAAITDDIDGAQSDAITLRQGDYDPSDYDDFASGGIARMLGE